MKMYLYELVFKYISEILFLSQRKIRENKNIYFENLFFSKETIFISIIRIEK